MSWETQGRQDHGWFGHGTGPGSPGTPAERNGRPAGVGTLDQRISTVVGSLLGHFSPADRKHSALQPEGRTAANVTQAMRVWVAAARLGGEALAKSLPETTSDAMRSRLRDAALLTVRAHDPATLNEAGAALASAAGTMGLDRWRQFAATAAHTAAVAMAASPAAGRGDRRRGRRGAGRGVRSGRGRHGCGRWPGRGWHRVPGGSPGTKHLCHSGAACGENGVPDAGADHAGRRGW